MRANSFDLVFNSPAWELTKSYSSDFSDPVLIVILRNPFKHQLIWNIVSSEFLNPFKEAT
jgi:hypothetical protein